MTTYLPPSILVVGTGSLACLFAARLAASGVRVTMLGSWKEGLAALAEHGVRILENGEQRACPVSVTSDPQECTDLPLALVLVKSWGTARAAEQLALCLPHDGLALTLQNGLGNREILADKLGSERVAMGITTCGANLVAPGVVRPAGEGTTTLIDQPDPRLLGELLEIASFDVSYTDDASSLVWTKLVINASINPLTTLLGVHNGELLERPNARSLMGQVALETAAVASAHGVAIGHPDPAALVEGVARRTAANRSSMLQDISRGTPTEVDAINGAVVAAAEQRGAVAPINRALWQLVKAMEEGREKIQ